MGLRGIALYSLRALAFAAVVCALYALYCCCRGRRLLWRRLMGIAYIAALVQITVLRGGVDWQTVFSTGRAIPQLVPFKTTLEEARLGLWLLIYHTIGNMIWFVPLGILLRRKRVWQTILAGAALSLGIEIMQFVLRTGMSDIDDIILNAAGAGVGWLAARIMKKHGFK